MTTDLLAIWYMAVTTLIFGLIVNHYRGEIAKYRARLEMLDRDITSIKKSATTLVLKLDKPTYDELIVQRLLMAIKITYANENINNDEELNTVNFRVIVITQFIEMIGPKLITEHDAVYGEGDLINHVNKLMTLWAANGTLKKAVLDIKLQQPIVKETTEE